MWQTIFFLFVFKILLNNLSVLYFVCSLSVRRERPDLTDLNYRNTNTLSNSHSSDYGGGDYKVNHRGTFIHVDLYLLSSNLQGREKRSHHSSPITATYQSMKSTI